MFYTVVLVKGTTNDICLEVLYLVNAVRTRKRTAVLFCSSKAAFQRPTSSPSQLKKNYDRKHKIQNPHYKI